MNEPKLPTLGGHTESKRYGAFSGNPRGFPEDPELCIETVWPKWTWTDKQCSRKRGHGEGGLYCKQHAKRHPPTPESPNE